MDPDGSISIKKLSSPAVFHEMESCLDDFRDESLVKLLSVLTVLSKLPHSVVVGITNPSLSLYDSFDFSEVI